MSSFYIKLARGGGGSRPCLTVSYATGRVFETLV